MQENAYGLWARKKGLVGDGPDNADARFGRAMEGGVLDLYRDRCPFDTVVRSSTQRMPGHPRVVATPDAAVYDDEGRLQRLVEVKCPRSDAGWGPEGTDQIPEKHWYQVQQQMAVTGAPVVHVVALFWRDISIFPVRRNAEAIDLIVRVIETFWRRYMEGDERPPPDGTDACSEELAQRYPRPEGKPLVQTEVCAATAAEYVRWRNAETEACSQKRRCGNMLREFLTDAYGVAGDWGRAVLFSKLDKKTDHQAMVVDLCGELGIDRPEALRRYSTLRDKYTTPQLGKPQLRVTLKGQPSNDE